MANPARRQNPNPYMRWVFVNPKLLKAESPPSVKRDVLGCASLPESVAHAP